jgi:pyrimidine operon attenuation protein/uracil phosphoribosyltransferase
VVDDVLLTGKTLLHALQPFVQWELKKLQVAVLVDRNYATYPIKANYVGYALSTTIDEHVEVELLAETKAVYLR